MGLKDLCLKCAVSGKEMRRPLSNQAERKLKVRDMHTTITLVSDLPETMTDIIILFAISVEIPEACGQSSVGSNRVVHGEPARLNEWPWIAALGYKNSSTGQIVYRCGATLVTARHVVTAAHCVREDLTTVLLGVRLWALPDKL